VTGLELERRLRSAASTYERLAPTVPHLERSIFDRIALTPREVVPQRGRVGRRSWTIQLFAAAALVLFAITVAFLVRESRLFREPQPVTTPKPYTIPSPTSAATQCSSVARQWASSPARPAKMLSSTTGWAYGPMRTSDGGAHWVDVSPPSIPGRTNKNDEFFLDATHAWVAETASSSKACVDHVVTLRTADAGRTWQQASPIPVRYATPTDVIWTGKTNHASWFSFVDAEHGWLLLGTGPASFSGQAGVDPSWIGATWSVGDLYRSTDGGLHWTLIATFPGSTNGCSPASAAGWLPEAGMSFSSATTGWILSTCGLLVTHDAGASWSKSTAPLAPTAVPVFFDQNHGVAVAAGGVLVTSDGGARWAFGSSPGGELGAIDFSNPNDGWAVASGDSNVQCAQSDLAACSRNFRLYRTNDGGKTWVPGNYTSLTLPARKSWPPSYLHFVDSRNGFADPGEVGLFRTNDGGRTWTAVEGIVQGP
jgi:hypothetical protein